MKTKRLLLLPFAVLAFSLANCSGGQSQSSSSSSSASSSVVSIDSSSSSEEQNPVYSVKEAIALAKDSSTTGKVYSVKGKVVSFQNYYYGQLTIGDDEGNTLSVYGLRGETESVYFDQLDVVPMVGDTITIKGEVKLYNSTPEMGTSLLQSVELTHEVPNLSEYSTKTIAEGRNVSVGTKIKLTGVVGEVTRTQKMSYNGFYLVDGTGSIFVYGGQSACRVKKGNTVTVIGSLDNFISSSESSYASMYGYKGAIQLADSYVISNDKGSAELPTSWMEEKTMKEILAIEPSATNITSNSYLVTGVINKEVATGYVNYYLNDLDQHTGGRVYTSNSGSDFSYLDAYVGKVCKMVVSPINCKSTASGLEYRFIPLDVKIIEDYKFDLSLAPKFALDYVAVDQFEPTYYVDPELEVVTSYFNSLIGVEGLSIAYSSNNEGLAYFEETDGKTVFHVTSGSEGNATITITASLNGVSASQDVAIAVKKAEATTSTVKQAIDAASDTQLTVRGVVAGKTLNKVGFYIVDDTGAIAVQVSSEDALAKVETGDEVIVTGTRAFGKASTDGSGFTGQINLQQSSVDAVVGKNKAYSRASILDKTFSELNALCVMGEENLTAQIYHVSAYLSETTVRGYTVANLFENEEASKQTGAAYIGLYSGGNGQYAYLASMVNKQIELDLALVCWNGKGSYYKFCPLDATYDGVTVQNPVNA